MTGETILITGGLGFLGRRFTRHLKNDGYNVVVLENRPSDDPAEVTSYTVDITDKKALNELFAKEKIDKIIHLAAVSEDVCVSNAELAFNVNCFGTKNVLEAAKKANVKRVVFMSSFHVYGKGSGTITEETVPTPTHPYGITKLVGEIFCRDAVNKGLSVAIMRSANGYGRPVSSDTDRWKLLVLNLCRQAHEKGKLTLNTHGYQLRDFIGIDDQYQAVKILLHADLDDDPVYNVSFGKAFPIREFARMIQTEYEKLYGKKIPLEIPDGEPDNSTLDVRHDKIAKLGFVPKKEHEDNIREILQFCEKFRL